MRVGIDLVAIDSIREAIDRHGDRYLDRTYTPGELAACRTGAGNDAARLAACFAAKEAAVKALRPPAETAIPWTELELRRAMGSGWTVEFTGAAAILAADAGLGELSVSLSTQPGLAAAVVIARFGA